MLELSAVSFRTDRCLFLRLRRNLTPVSGFHTKAPLSPFPLTQIEMTGSFPIDSSTCESRTLFLQFRRGTEHFWTAVRSFPRKTVLLAGSDEDFQKLLLRIAAKAGERSGCPFPDPVFLPGHARVLSSVRRLFLALPLRRRAGRRTSRRKTGGAFCRASGCVRTRVRSPPKRCDSGGRSSPIT